MANTNTLKLYHASSEIIRRPDVHYGRRNADFGGGFYLSDSMDFAKKWASTRKAYVNRYTFDMTGLTVKRLKRGKDWFRYIVKNRAGAHDIWGDTDVIIGPIANDTLYDTYGIITSGLISEPEAIKLLNVGNTYYQITIKTEKAIAQLIWEDAVLLTPEDIETSRNLVKAEEAVFRKAFIQALTELDNYAFIKDILT